MPRKESEITGEVGHTLILLHELLLEKEVAEDEKEEKEVLYLLQPF